MARAFSIWIMTRRQRIGLLLLCSILFALLAYMLVAERYSAKNVEESKDWLAGDLQQFHESWLENNAAQASTNYETVSLEPFNPNALNAEGWEQLGFSPKQAESLMKYRYSLGGNFTTSEQIRDAFVVSEWKYEQLKPYIQIAHVGSNPGRAASSYERSTYTRVTQARAVQLRPFDPNLLDSVGWLNLNFSPRQVQNILKYKNSLPGREFSSLDQIKASYMISDEKYAQLKPYIRLKESQVQHVNSTAQLSLTSIHVNIAAQADFVQLGLSKQEADAILKCRSFKGTFKDLQDLMACPNAAVEKLEKLDKYLLF